MFLLKFPDTHDPAINLALEEYALRSLDGSGDFLFIYENTPCVMLGKNQNPYEEVNPVFLEKNKIPLYRRMSGGGAVFHGPGNINFTMIVRRKANRVNNYAYFLKPVADYLNILGAGARMNERNDLVIGGYKISGNAQFTSRDRMFSHGTLLFNADIDRLGAALKPAPVVIESKCTPSKHSAVQNILPALKQPVSIRMFVRGLSDHLLGYFGDQGVYMLSGTELETVRNLAIEKYRRDAWIWGRTPQFTVHSSLRGKGCAVRVKNGHILDITVEAHAPFLKALEGVLYKRRELDVFINKLFANYSEIDYNPGEISQAIYPFV